MQITGTAGTMFNSPASSVNPTATASQVIVNSNLGIRPDESFGYVSAQGVQPYSAALNFGAADMSVVAFYCMSGSVTNTPTMPTMSGGTTGYWGQPLVVFGSMQAQGAAAPGSLTPVSGWVQNRGQQLFLGFVVYA